LSKNVRKPQAAGGGGGVTHIVDTNNIRISKQY